MPFYFSTHLHIDRFIHQLNDIFSIASLVNLCCSTSILVLFCFMGTNVTSINDLIQYLMNAFSSIVELFVMCWFSQKIRNSVSSHPKHAAVILHVLRLLCLCFRAHSFRKALMRVLGTPKAYAIKKELFL